MGHWHCHPRKLEPLMSGISLTYKAFPGLIFFDILKFFSPFDPTMLLTFLWDRGDRLI